MTDPRVPGGDQTLELPCGRRIGVAELDLGQRELRCSCGEVHAVVMDVHPPTRFVPEFLVEVLQDAIETDDDHGPFGTTHVMGVVLEEFPEEVVAADVAENGRLGCSLVWVSAFDSRRLHEVVVELLVELMDHAVSHADDEDAAATFQRRLEEFDVETFVEQYREQRGFESEREF